MSISYQVLGKPGRDNALRVRIDSGQAVAWVHFDCGEDCLDCLTSGEVLDIDHIFFSHLHMDHIGGFDSFFRCTFDRQDKPNHLWGPPQTSAILQHRFQGFMWNLHGEMRGSWWIHDLHEGYVHCQRFELNEAFARTHEEGTDDCNRIALEHSDYQVEFLTMDHRTPSLAYLLREKPSLNVRVDKLMQCGLKPGPWLQEIKEPAPGQSTISIAGTTHALADLQKDLLQVTPGDTIAYLTDFLLDERAMNRLIPFLSGCGTLVCECQYRQADRDLASRNYHMTTQQVGELAHQAGARELILFHLSDRYTRAEWREMLEEVRAIFPDTHFPNEWRETLGGTW